MTLELRHCKLFSVRYDSERALSSRKKLPQDHVPYAGTRSAIVPVNFIRHKLLLYNLAKYRFDIIACHTAIYS